MEEHAKKASNGIANCQTCSCTKFSASLIDNHKFKEEELETVGELSRVCCRVVLKIRHSVRIDRPDTLWSVIKLTRDVTKWTIVRGPFDIVHSHHE